MTKKAVTQTSASTPTPEQREAEAKARSAEAAAAKAEREEREASSPAAVARRVTTADDEAAKARRENLATALPDLGKATRGELSVNGDGGPAAGTGVAGVAITNAATAVVEQVKKVVGADDWSILVTNDIDLVTTDATYLSVEAGLARLDELATTAATAADTAMKGPHTRGLASVGLALAAAGQLIPGILSLLSKPKTLTTGAIDFDDLTASVAVAGRLKSGNSKRRVLHDQFRLVPRESETDTAIEQLRGQRETLATLRGVLERWTGTESEATVAPTEAAAVVPASIADALALVAQVITAIDTFLQLLERVPDGATRSSRVTAILQESIRSGAHRVLLVKAQSASGMQLVANNLIADDRFSVVVAATISWMLTDQSGEILSAGLATGTAQACGRIGDSFSFTT